MTNTLDPTRSYIIPAYVAPFTAADLAGEISQAVEHGVGDDEVVYTTDGRPVRELAAYTGGREDDPAVVGTRDPLTVGRVRAWLTGVDPRARLYTVKQWVGGQPVLHRPALDALAFGG